ncbi:MAG TPA: aldo/keto reductase [Oculatellaceae cyanobacterium]
MEKRKIGKQGLEVSAIGLGCMGMSQSYGEPADDAEAIKVIHRALALGVDFFDTAEVYGPYKNELLLGKAFRDRRDLAIIATKFGFNIEDGKMIGVNSHPKNVKRACEESLKRLGVEYIDLYYQHRVDPKVPIEEVVGAMSELVEAGKVRYLGLSEAGSETLRRANREHAISALQSEYSIWERGIEENILPTCRELGIGLVPFSPVGRGVLSGNVKEVDSLSEGDFRRRVPRLQGEHFKKNLKLVDIVSEVAKKYEATPAQVAIAWTLHQGQDVAPIPGTKRIKYLEENCAAADLKLDKSDLEILATIAEKMSGARYDERGLSMIER